MLADQYSGLVIFIVVIDVAFSIMGLDNSGQLCIQSQMTSVITCED